MPLLSVSLEVRRTAPKTRLSVAMSVAHYRYAIVSLMFGGVRRFARFQRWGCAFLIFRFAHFYLPGFQRLFVVSRHHRKLDWKLWITLSPLIFGCSSTPRRIPETHHSHPFLAHWNCLSFFYWESWLAFGRSPRRWPASPPPTLQCPTQPPSSPPCSSP